MQNHDGGKSKGDEGLSCEYISIYGSVTKDLQSSHVCQILGSLSRNIRSNGLHLSQI